MSAEGEEPAGMTHVQQEQQDVQQEQDVVQQDVTDAQQQQDADVIQPADADVESGGSSSSSGSRTPPPPSLPDSTPGEWEQAFAESPSLDRTVAPGMASLDLSIVPGLTSLDMSIAPGPASLDQSVAPDPPPTPASFSSCQAELWRMSEGHHEEPVLNDCPPSAGDSPDRVAARHYTVTMPEEVDRIERAPQSTPRPEAEGRSPHRAAKRPWEGPDTEMPRAKYLLRRLSAMVPAARPADVPKLREDRLEAAAQALRQLLHAWKRLLGLTACARLPEVSDRLAAKPSVLRRLCPALWILVFVLLGLGGVGLQWARCQKLYLRHLTPDAKPDNVTLPEYVCEHSFVWTYLLPRLIYILGYVSVFVCWFCLRQADFITVVAEVYDSVTDQHEYPAVSDRFYRCCRADRRRLAALFVLVALLSAVASLFGDGVIAGTASDVTNSSANHAAIVLAADVFNFVVMLILDNVMFFVLVTATLAIKYFDLILLKTQTHLGNIAGQAHISSDCYVRPQCQRGARLMAQSQAAVSAVLLMVLLRVCQAVTLVLLDQTRDRVRTESLGLLPIVVVYTAVVIYYIYASCRLTADGRLHHRRHVSTGPDFATGGTPETDEVTGDDDSAPLEPRAGASAPPKPARWASKPAPEECPAITGRVFGLDAGPWMFALLALMVVCYCAGYYTVERFWPLF